MKDPIRASADGIVMACLWLLLVALARADVSINYYLNGLTIAVVISSITFAVRLRLDGDTWAARLTFDVIATAFFWAGLMLIVLPFSGFVSPEAWNTIIRQWSPARTLNRETIRLILLLTFYASGITVVVMRGIRWMLFIVQRLRRRHLMWQLASSHFILVLTFLFVLFTLVVANSSTNISPIEDNPENLFGLVVQSFAAFIVVSVLVLLTLIIIAVPTAVVSYAYSSQISDALAELTNATDALRNGDYLARIPVNRHDEIGQLQRDFNGMAGTLLQTMRSIQRDRDRVTRLLQTRRELFAGISHELRTPIATLRSYLEATNARSEGSISPAMKHDLGIIHQETMRLQTLIDDMFTLARTEVNRLELKVVPVDVVPIIERIAASAAEMVWQRSRIEMLTDLPPTPLSTRVDVLRFEQILQNLLQYAVFQTSPGGIIIISARQLHRHIEIDVKDTGPPLSDETLRHLWQRFSTTGLGLPLVKELTEAMNGSVSVQNIDPQGHCFQLRFPPGEA